jgi:hypothetical protein
MEVTKMSGKQLLIQFAINLVTSAIVAYVTYKLLQPKETTTTPPAANQISTVPPVTVTTSTGTGL